MDNVNIIIPPRAQGYVTYMGLIRPTGTFDFKTRYSEVGEGGCIFRVASDDYLFECGFTNTEIYLQRNTYRLNYILQPIYRPLGSVRFFVIWDIFMLKITVLDEGWIEANAEMSGKEGIEEIEKRSRVLLTPPTLPPNSLLRWARKQAILPLVTYDTNEHFYGVVATSLENIDDQIQSTGLTSPFWDITYERSHIKARKPKRETDVHPTIQALLYNIAQAKNFEVVREPLIAGGQLDFLISGPVATGGLAHVCVEFKPAHSNDLLDGLLKQLPAYMQAKGCDFGIYAVLYFKGKHFPEPTDFESVGALELFLMTKAMEAGLSNLRILVIDVSHKKPPSQL